MNRLKGNAGPKGKALTKKPVRPKFGGLNHPNAVHWMARELRGIYFLICSKGTVVYVGMSEDILTRVMQHRRGEFGRRRLFATAWFVELPLPERLPVAEGAFIRVLQPYLNTKGMLPARPADVRAARKLGYEGPVFG